MYNGPVLVLGDGDQVQVCNLTGRRNAMEAAYRNRLAFQFHVIRSARAGPSIASWFSHWWAASLLKLTAVMKSKRVFMR